MRRVSVVLLVALAACAEGRVTSDVASEGQVLEVTCNGRSTEIHGSRVQAMMDGVHLQIHNTSGATLDFAWSGGGDGVQPGDSAVTLPLWPGRGELRCLPNGVDPGQAGGWATFTVVAPDGWIPPTCPGENFSDILSDGSGAGVQDPLREAQRLSGSPFAIEVGYKGSDMRTVLAIDNGKPSAIYRFMAGGSGWDLTGMSYCA